MNQWELRWQERKIGFHLSEVNDYLKRHSEKFLKNDIKKIFVPFCGKSLDLSWLAKRIDKVVGVELVKRPVKEFFEENKLNYTIKSLGKFELFQSDSIDIFNGDFFDLINQQTGRFDAIYDRASIVSVEYKFRSKYVDHLMKFLVDGGKILLITLEYDQDEMHGPPYSVPFLELKNLFSENADLELLETRDILDKRLREKGLSQILERVIQINKK